MPSDYPLFESRAQTLKTPTGLAFSAITLDAVLDGTVRMEDLRVTSEALELQAGIAEDAGRPQLAANLRRAAELTAVPEEEILAIYDALRPGRADPAALERLAVSLEERYGAVRCARLIRDAAEAST